jgi:hypothetical protein
MRRARACLLAGLVAAACWAEAPRITVQAEAVPAGENLLANPSFEEGADQWPDAWGWAPNQPTKVLRFWAEEGFTGRRAARVRNDSAAASGYWTQIVPVEPGHDYLLTARVTIEDGKLLLRAQGLDAEGQPVPGCDRRAYAEVRARHIMAPVFWEPAWIVNMIREPWAPISLSFSTRGEPAPTQVNVQVGSYFSSGAQLIDDVYLGPGALTLSYAVAADGIASVRVTDETDAELARHGPTADARVEGRLEGLPLGGRYRIEATSRAGDVAEAWYPAPPEGAQ